MLCEDSQNKREKQLNEKKLKDRPTPDNRYQTNINVVWRIFSTYMEYDGKMTNTSMANERPKHPVCPAVQTRSQERRKNSSMSSQSVAVVLVSKRVRGKPNTNQMIPSRQECKMVCPSTPISRLDAKVQP